jgi:pyrroloquinoline quinone (PQQ) biosynthesis protein C
MLSGNGKLKRHNILDACTRGPPTFSHELDATTFRERLRFLTIPQVRAGLTGAITREVYLAYLAQAWHHVRHTVPLMHATRDRVRRGPEMTAALDTYIAEESGHDEWILSDIAAAGGDAEAVRRSSPAPATAAMIAHAYHKISSGNALAQRGAAAVAERLGLPPEAFTYLTSHGALDADHLRFFADFVNGLTDAEDRQAIVTMAREMFGLFGAVFATIPLEDIDVAA